MNRNLRVLLGFAAIALVVVFAGMAKADDLVVTNSDFESPVLDPGGYAPVTAHTYSGNWAQVNGNDGTAGVYRPDVGQMPGSPDSLPAPGNGKQLFIDADSDNGEVAIMQTLNNHNPVLGYLQADMKYTLTISVGSLTDVPFQGVYYGFTDPESGGALMVAGLDGLSFTGGFQEVSVTLYSDDVIDNDLVNVGDRIGVFINLGGEGTVADNVRVTAETVPEPSTLALLAAGMFGLLAYAWRKRK